ncbi:uncharacterized protein LOC110460283 [Mizuhopecten yessoensis]|uniref:uncharacterized protein LOC110460283 n=1 Tax=Mizuhopecten yessoensis TaxID=6573 RepID=UPI000B45C12B|nr:uncharacterized protein LOC110460283 [Mizuhopecten yessoensis]
MSTMNEGDSISSARKQKRPKQNSESDTSDAGELDLPVIKKLKSRKGRPTPRPVDGSDSDLDPPAKTSTPISNKKQKVPPSEGTSVSTSMLARWIRSAMTARGRSE